MSSEDTKQLSTVFSPFEATVSSALAAFPLTNLMQQAQDYWVDAVQRQILFLDILRQRGNTQVEHQAKSAPNVLHFESVILIDGRDLLDPVNYMLMRMLPPDGIVTDPTKRPFIVFDPRAGHGPGIGGMKRESEIGLALMNGHPVYFVSFLPEPVKGQTIEDVCAAEAHFVSKVIEWHPDAGKPCLIGNCQAGWQIALMSATQPKLPGVLILAGAPMSYWAGVHGANPMRYTGGITGGSWIVAMASDFGDGLFDGANLIENFEKNNPSNTYWKKEYTVYTKVDTEGPRFLEFERWWSSPILLGREEIQFIVDDLFIGNNLATGKIHTSGGVRADLRNIKSPIIVFCSHGDDITSPQQALGWILEMYGCDDDIIANGQTIIYSMHKNIGHLGIFVSTSVASKEHQKFISNIDMIETLPPGLYEATFTSKSSDVTNSDLASGDYILRFEKRGLENIRALGGNDHEDDMRFATVARISENLQGLYYTFVSPVVRSLVSRKTADVLRELHPLRAKVSFYSDKNPLFSNLAPLAEKVRENRKPVAANNIFWAMQQAVSDQIIRTLDDYNDRKNNMIETMFMHIYGSPLLQAAVGMRTVRPYAKPALERDVELETERNRRLLKLMIQMDNGGLAEAMIRGLLYVSRADHAVDEREYTMLQRMRTESNIFPNMNHDEYKALARQQYMMLLLDEDRAVRAISNLLDNADGREKEALELIRRIVEASGQPTSEEEKRLARLAELFTPAHATPHRRATDKAMALPDGGDDD